MKTAAIVLGIVGGAFGFLGGLFTMFFGEVGKALDASGADAVTNIGAWSIFMSLLALVFSCFIGKKPKIMSIIVLVLGVVCVILANYFSGIVIFIGGVLGLVPAFSKSVEDKQTLSSTL
jgi:hypothetical protein